MKFKKIKNLYIVRINRGEKIIEHLQALIEAENIRAGRISGIGAVNHAILNYYSYETKEYIENIYKQEMEITGMSGNIAVLDKKPTAHIHINLADEENKVIGGHLKEATVSGTVELIIEIWKGVKLERKFDEDTELYLLDI